MTLTIRAADLAQDGPEIAAIDRSFETSTIFALSASDHGLELREARLQDPISKTFPLDDLERPWTFAIVGVEDSRIIGFAAAEHHDWNRRMVLWHLYVDRPARARGVARRLLERVEEHARGLGALNIWLETSNLNTPGFRAYRRLGFDLSGLDATLYEGTAAEGEFALFLTRSVQRSPPRMSRGA